MIKTKDLLLFEKAANFVKLYNGETPLAESLRSHFKIHKNMGVNDRRRFSQIVFSYFRAGRLFSGSNLEGNLMLSCFLLGTEETMIIKAVCSTFSFIKPETFEKTIEEKVRFLIDKEIISPETKIFPYPELLSRDVDKDAYTWSLFRQSLVFIRVRKNYMKEVMEELMQNEIKPVVSEQNNECLGFEPSSKLTLLDSFEKGKFVIQDRNSQRTLDDIPELKPTDYWWDCCCGAGGKSLLFKEKFPNNRIVLSDTRKSILENAKT